MSKPAPANERNVAPVTKWLGLPVLETSEIKNLSCVVSADVSLVTSSSRSKPIADFQVSEC